MEEKVEKEKMEMGRQRRRKKGTKLEEKEKKNIDKKQWKGRRTNER